MARTTDSRQALAQKLRRGHDVTLVLGAGVSVGRGIPTWRELASRLCKSFGVGLPAGFADAHPLALPIAFEQVAVAAKSPARFVNALRRALYEGLQAPKEHDTLSVLCELLCREQASARRRLRRVITFNADDLLEAGSCDARDAFRNPTVWPISSESSRLRMASGAGRRSPVPIYHVHGFLPQASSPWMQREGRDSLVFTEAEYWRSFVEPTSFPNRVLLGALHDSVCIFLGLSMTDMNIARWLGFRANAIARDPRADGGSQYALDHHFWIRQRAASDSPTEFVATHLRRRGVRSIALESWGELDGLVKGLFPGRESASDAAPISDIREARGRSSAPRAAPRRVKSR